MSSTSVLIVDDSATQRRLIADALSSHPDIEIAGEAADAYEARDLVKQRNPDVLTLDVEMPGMNGLEFLGRLMRARPRPVIMVSSHTSRGDDAAIRALSMGAVACIGKPSGGNPGNLYRKLPELVRLASGARMHQVTPAEGKDERRLRPRPVVDESFRPGNWLVAIGSSTGGVEALTAVLSHYPALCPPTVISQHMPENFLRSLATRLDNFLPPKVSLAKDGDLLEPGRVFIAPGDRHVEIRGTDGRCRIALSDAPAENGHRPSVDVMFRSLVPKARKVLAVQLTGMGNDGAAEMLSLRKAGARTIGQDKATSMIYGMPARAFELGAVERQLPLEQIGAAILDQTRRVARPN
ncbi:protein-glutamate methylesterase/protein-glutamine glutaminase [Poseidonocella sedimentorum]|uniref:Protein-glutamate methylesterase/protein-glutamine glutaminase n=1 Tax=Poseidonocella sedimentorum TaxID=871652 RepID=A0A1I6CXV7_9RHOB|nr:chemotaxis response regulator protein-glutamate methylesterase [Poseidonocella sedimentorum]SFQ97951.1 two-component system, chemotaxis family, response regulator CheB [Poseidonocella sedimentorum]